MNGIDYDKPTVKVLHSTPLINAEIAGRTAYDSFANSEHEQIRNFAYETIEDVGHSDLLDSLCHVYHHMSVAEHINITYAVKGISRGVLQELVRHRIASYTVRSTRYTMGSILNAFIASNDNREAFRRTVPNFSIFPKDTIWFAQECEFIFSRLKAQKQALGDEAFSELALSKEARAIEDKTFKALESAKKKRNVGDAFKHIVTDNWSVDLVMTMNLRSLKNFLQLRDSQAAYFQIQWLAQEIKKATPDKYIKLIVKDKR